METVDRLFEAIVEANIAKAERLVDSSTREMGHQQVLTELLTPLLNRIGDIEQTAVLNLAQGYVTSKIVKRILTEYEQAFSTAGAWPRGSNTVVLCNAEDDCHPIGREIVCSILRGHEWCVSDLGIDVEAPVLVDEAIGVRAKVVGVSAMTYTTAANVHKVREEITTRGLTGKLKLAVGGVAFRLDPELVANVGADGTAASALQAPTLFRRLWDEADDEGDTNHDG